MLDRKKRRPKAIMKIMAVNVQVNLQKYLDLILLRYGYAFSVMRWTN